MRIDKIEMKFFQDIYLDGLRIRYIDESMHSPYKYSIEYHDDGALVSWNIATSEKEILKIAREFINEHSSTARHSQTAFFILRLSSVKICYSFE